MFDSIRAARQVFITLDWPRAHGNSIARAPYESGAESRVRRPQIYCGRCPSISVGAAYRLKGWGNLEAPEEPSLTGVRVSAPGSKVWESTCESGHFLDRRRRCSCLRPMQPPSWSAEFRCHSRTAIDGNR